MVRYFVGNNTGRGFFSFYADEIASADRVLMLKGAPGTGKSSLMKKVAKEAQKRGYSVEVWYCSGDADSLDGVRVVELNRILFDSTSPHAYEPTLPIIKERIFNLADGLRAKELSSNGDEITKYATEKKMRYALAYSRLRCATEHYSRLMGAYEATYDERVLKAMAKSVCADIIAPRGDAQGLVAPVRNLFYHAISPQGEIKFYDHLQGKKLILLKGGSPLALRRFFDYLIGCFDSYIAFRNPLEPMLCECLIAEKVAISDDAGQYENQASEIIDLDLAQRREPPRDVVNDAKVKAELEKAAAVAELALAREAHLQIEQRYIGAMDFAVVDEITAKITADLLGE